MYRDTLLFSFFFVYCLLFLLSFILFLRRLLKKFLNKRQWEVEGRRPYSFNLAKGSSTFFFSSLVFTNSLERWVSLDLYTHIRECVFFFARLLFFFLFVFFFLSSKKRRRKEKCIATSSACRRQILEIEFPDDEGPFERAKKLDLRMVERVCVCVRARVYVRARKRMRIKVRRLKIEMPFYKITFMWQKKNIRT